MKRAILTLVATAISLPAFGQGHILFANDSNHYIVIGFPADPDIGGGTSSTNGNTPSGATGAIPISPLPSQTFLEAALYAGQSSNSLTLQTTVVLSGANWLSDGRMANKSVTLPFVGGTTTFFDIFVVDTAATLPGSGSPPTLGFGIAASAGVYFGDSGLFTAVPGTGLSFPSIATAATQSTWTTDNLVINYSPEPGSLSLMGLGVAGMFLFRGHNRRITALNKQRGLGESA